MGSAFFGWRVVATAFVVAVFAWGIGFYGPSVYLRTLQVERGWSALAISSATTAHFLIGAALVAFLPEAHQRLGLAVVTRAGAALLAAGALAWSLAQAPWQLFAAAVLSGAGWAATSGAALNAMVAPWFNRHRPMAIAMAFNGAGLGGVIFPPLWVALIAALSFPGAAAVVGAAALLAVWPLAGRYLRPTPASLGVAPDGDGASRAVATTAASGSAARTVPASRAGLLRDRRFATIAPAFALSMFSLVGLYAHLVALLAPVLGDVAAAGAVSLAAASMVAGRTTMAWLLGSGGDRRLASVASFVAQGCGAALLLTAVPGSASPFTAAAAVLGCGLLGLGGGNLVSLQPLLAQAEFRPSDVSRVVALAAAVCQAAFALAPAALGALHDVTGSYAAPIALAIAAQLAAVAVVLAGRSRQTRL